jgi:hypothetical protein
MTLQIVASLETAEIVQMPNSCVPNGLRVNQEAVEIDTM